MNNTPNSPVYYYQPIIPPKPKYFYTREEFWLALLLWLVGYFYVAALPVSRHPLPALAVQVVLLVATYVYLTRKNNPFSGGLRATPWCTTLLCVDVALAISLLWSVNRAVLAAVTIWNTLSWFYIVLHLTGNSQERFPGQHFLQEVFGALSLPFRAPATGFGALFGSKQAPDGTPRPKSRIRSIVGWAGLGLLMAGIPTLVIVLLLSYDEGFARIIDRILDAIFSAISVRSIFRQINNVGFGLLAGVLLFGAFLGGKTLKARSDARRESLLVEGTNQTSVTMTYAQRDGAHVAPVSLMVALLTPIMAVYVIFFISQWDYYISAFTGVRPEEFTFSAYAREGFFQLLAVTVINACLGLSAALLSRRRVYDPERSGRDRTHPLIRIYLAVLSLMTLILIATALSKMILYVDTYGMSHKRIYATWLMVLLAVAFVAVILRQLWVRMNLTGTLVAVSLAFFLMLALIPVDALIVRYNVNAALDGNLRTMQGDVCMDSGMAGVLPALDFMEKIEDADLSKYDADQLEAVRISTDTYLYRMADELDAMDWHEHNITTLRAKAALEKTGYITEEEPHGIA